MEDLNKNQIILLTLLVSFVTSIATGIVTVTLMDQAPQGVTRTINHIVERTVEKVVPGETQVSTVVKEVPVIITEEELIVDAINTASPSVFMLKGEKDRKEIRLGSAIYVDKRGYFATSLNLVGDDVRNIKIFDDEGKGYEAEIFSRGSRIALLKISNKSLPVFVQSHTETEVVKISIADINVGQSVIGVGATEGGNHTVSVGIVSSLSGLGNATTTTVNTNASATENIGGPLLQIKGEVIGLSISPGMAISAREVKGLIDSAK